MFPLRAGVIGEARNLLQTSLGVSPACGGYRRKQQKIMELIAYFPCVRGVSGLYRTRNGEVIFRRKHSLAKYL